MLYQRQPPHLLLTILHLKQTHYLYNCLHHKLLGQITSLLQTQVTLEGKLRHLVYCYMNDNGGGISYTIFVFGWLPYCSSVTFSSLEGGCNDRGSVPSTCSSLAGCLYISVVTERTFATFALLTFLHMCSTFSLCFFDVLQILTGHFSGLGAQTFWRRSSNSGVVHEAKCSAY